MATISKRTKKNGETVYTAQIRLKVDGRQYSEAKSHADRKFLERWAPAREEQLRQPGAIDAINQQAVTVGQVFKWYMEDFQNSKTFGRTKLQQLVFLSEHEALAPLNAIKLSPAQLIGFARARSATAKPPTILGDFIWISNAMNAVRLSRGLPLNMQAVEDAMQMLRKEKSIGKGKNRTRRPTLAELETALRYFSRGDGRAKLPMVDITLFALFSARRQNEICRIEWDDLDERRKGVLVRDMKHPRDEIDTFVFLTPEAWAVIQNQKRVDKRIFPFQSKSLSDAWRRMCMMRGIDDLNFHDLRHETISWLFEMHWAIPRVSGVSGHRSWSSLQRYTHLQHSEPHDKFAGWPPRIELLKS